METVGLRIGGRVWTGWKSVQVERGIEQAAGQFSLTLALKQSATDPIPIDARPGRACVLTAGDDPLLTGYIDTLAITEGVADLSVSVTGRSATVKAIKSSVTTPSSKFKGLNLEVFARLLCSPVGVDVLTVDVPTDAIEDTNIQVGEPRIEAIERVCRERGCLLTDDGDGHLVICRVGSGRGDAIKYGTSRVLSWSYTGDASERYTDYQVVGQRAGDDTRFGTDAASNAAVAYDPLWTSETYILRLRAEGNADAKACLNRANWEAASRAGKATRMTMTLPGWRWADGTLREPNVRCYVEYPRAKVARDLLLVKVAYSIGDDGEATTCEFAPPSAFTPQPTTRDKKRTTPAGDPLWQEDWGE